MKILLIGMSESVHMARWLSQINDQGWDIHLFPSKDFESVHPQIKNTTVHHSFYSRYASSDSSLKKRGIPVFANVLAIAARRFLEKFFPDYRIKQLASLIEKMQPDIIHSLEIQHAAYLTLEAQKRCRGVFPPWIVTNWGSDIYLFGRLPEHEPKIRELLSLCDYYSCECKRDVCLAKAYGFNGTVLPVFPNTGGFDLAAVERLKQPGPVSARRKIMLKGYQHWAGRALVGLRALERCADMLSGYEVVVYLVSDDVRIAAELFQHDSGVPVRIIQQTSHEEILRLHGQARISIGLSISDAISTSFLEAMVMGAFPIQSWTACADEWVEDGVSGVLVPSDDPDVVERAIRRALTDDGLVNRAAEINAETARVRLDHRQLSGMAVDFYRSIANEREIACN